MKERPILFNSEMVRAVLEGRKTQTRRVCKVKDVGLLSFDSYSRDGLEAMIRNHCPYGQPGDRLWVRETFMADYIDQGSPDIYYRASEEKTAPIGYWKPSIHMPRWASRITLEVTGIRVERVQDISIKDCVSEGINMDIVRYQKAESFVLGTPIEKAQFSGLWESINKKRGFGWDKNPWVWVVEFEKVGE